MRARVLSSLLVCGLFGLSCSDDPTDAIGGACDVIVGTCHVGSSRGECIDMIGDLSAECIDCLSRTGCNYPSCQVTVPGCRVPLELVK